MGIWHYTVGAKMKAILCDQVLKPATAGVPEGERTAVWFSTNPIWESTANKLWQHDNGTIVRLTKDETDSLCKGLFRIEVAQEAAPLTAFQFRKQSGIS